MTLPQTRAVAWQPTRVVTAAVAATLLLTFAPLNVAAQDSAGQIREVIGDSPDPIVGAVQISQVSHADGAASHAVIGRDDVFADNLAATSLVGRFGTLLLTSGGADRPIRPEVLAELQRALGPGSCDDGDPTAVYLVGGVAAVSVEVEQSVHDAGYCIARLAGPTRVQTAIAIAGVVGLPSDTIILARSDDWADAAAIGGYAARTNSRILVTPSTALDADVAAALRSAAPSQILLMGGTVALSEEVARAAADIAPVQRISGPTRDATAVAIATEVWGADASGSFAVGHGYAGTAWTYLFAAAPLGARRRLPLLYADDAGPTAVSQRLLDDAASILQVGPAVPPDALPVPIGDLSAVAVGLQDVGQFNSPLVMQARPGRGELWVAERAGVVRAIADGSTREVLDISSTVSTNGERGLLGMTFSADGSRLFTSTTTPAGSSVLDAFEVVGDTVDVSSREELLRVGQPASNHNGGDLHLGPDGNLWWSLGDGGGANDNFGNGQRTDTLLATLVRIAPGVDGGYTIPADNPFVTGGGAPEVWAYGLRNPFRFSFDPATDDLYIADVGQGEIEEINVLPSGTGAGSNLGWPVFEGTQPFNGGSIPNHTPPVWETTHAAGNCSITGGVVYRGSAIPDLYGAYLYSDLCNTEIRAILVRDGEVVQSADLGISIGSPVGFGVDHDGEVYVLSLSGPIRKIVPA